MQKSEYRNISRLENQHWWYKANREFVLSLLDKFLSPKPSLILDLGCGSGGTTMALQKYGQVTGIDISSEALRFARRHFISSLRRADINHLPYPAAKFDAAVCLDVLYHKSVNTYQAIREAFRVLRPGAIFLIRVPAFSFLRGTHDAIVHGARRFTSTQVKQLVEQAGFKVLNLTYYNFFLLLPLFLYRRLNLRHKSDIRSVRPPLNFCLYRLLKFEAWWAKRTGLPWGTSVYCVCSKPFGI